MKSSKYNIVQVYNVWVNGRDKEDVDQHFPIDSNVDREWHSDFDKAYKDYTNCVAPNVTEEGSYNDEIFQDYAVILFSFEVDIDEFEKDFELKFDLSSDKVQESIPYYINYDFNTVAEKFIKFKEL